MQNNENMRFSTLIPVAFAVCRAAALRKAISRTIIPFPKLFGDPGVVDAAAGTLSYVSVLSFNGTSLANFDIASLTFLATNNTATPLTSPTDVSIGLFGPGLSENIWKDSAGLVGVNPKFIDGLVTVNPVPVAVRQRPVGSLTHWKTPPSHGAHPGRTFMCAS